MSLSEFELIQRFFAAEAVRRPDVLIGIGDDAALVRVPEAMELAVTVDTLAEGTHFPQDTDPESLGHKVLAVNLSDLAAMGAEPAWASLALTLPAADDLWLDRFSHGLLSLAQRFGVQLVGGDTTRGPLTATVQALGLVPRGQALRRAGARPGDLIYVTGQLGDAGLALLALQQEVQLSVRDKEAVLRRLNQPEPRVWEGIALRGLASAAIDVSDGLAADLMHLLQASDVGAALQVQRLPLSPVLRSTFHTAGGWSLPLTAGDDYELCFTLPSDRQAELERRFTTLKANCTWIGMVEKRPGLRCLLDDGSDIMPPYAGYQHFR